MTKPAPDTYIKVRLDSSVFSDLEQFSQLRNIPKSAVASIGIKQFLANDTRWKMRQIFYAPSVKTPEIPAVGARVKIAFENKCIPHFAYIRDATVLNVTTHSFKCIVKLSDGPPYATVNGEGMDLSSGLLIEPDAVEGNSGVFELPNGYVWDVQL